MDHGRLVHEFLISLHKSIIPENLFAGWNGHRTLRIIDLEMFETVLLPKIRYWKEIKAIYKNFGIFAEACGFEVSKKQCGHSLHTYIKHTWFQRLNVEGIYQITPRNLAGCHEHSTVLDEQGKMSGAAADILHKKSQSERCSNRWTRASPELCYALLRMADAEYTCDIATLKRAIGEEGLKKLMESDENIDGYTDEKLGRWWRKHKAQPEKLRRWAKEGIQFRAMFSQ